MPNSFQFGLRRLPEKTFPIAYLQSRFGLTPKKMIPAPENVLPSYGPFPLILDSFTDPNYVPIDAHTPEIGSWNPTGDPYTQIDGNALRYYNEGHSFIGTPSFPTTAVDGYVEAILDGTLPYYNGVWMGIRNNDLYDVDIFISVNRFSIHVYAHGAYDTLISYHPAAVDVPIKVRLEFKKNIATLLVDGVAVGSADCSNPALYNRPEDYVVFELGQNPSFFIDGFDFCAVDQFEGGIYQ
jgi:hypothetical protein